MIAKTGHVLIRVVDGGVAFTGYGGITFVLCFVALYFILRWTR